MRIHTAAMFFAALGLAATPAAVRAASTDDARPVATITVTGHGRISRLPDVATVAVTIETNDDSAARALSENNRRFAALGVKLGANGVAAADIVSTSISSYYNPRPATPNAAGQLYGYIVTRNVQVNVNTLGAAGGIVDAATAAGATQINGITFGFRDPSAIERAALGAAVNDAYAQVQTIAGAAHVTVVRMLHISTDLGSPGRVGPLMKMALAAPESVPTTIAPSNLDVTGSVSVTYAVR